MEFNLEEMNIDEYDDLIKEMFNKKIRNACLAIAINGTQKEKIFMEKLFEYCWERKVWMMIQKHDRYDFKDYLIRFNTDEWIDDDEYARLCEIWYG